MTYIRHPYLQLVFKLNKKSSILHTVLTLAVNMIFMLFIIVVKVICYRAVVSENTRKRKWIDIVDIFDLSLPGAKNKRSTNYVSHFL